MMLSSMSLSLPSFPQMHPCLIYTHTCIFDIFICTLPSTQKYTRTNTRTHTHTQGGDRFLLVEGSVCAGTRAGMAHAHLLLTWFNANDNAASLTSLPPALKIPEARAGKKCQILLEKKKELRDLSTSKGFQIVSLRPRNHVFCFKVSEMPLKAPRLKRCRR